MEFSSEPIIMTFSGDPPLSMLEQRLHELLQVRSQSQIGLPFTNVGQVDLRPFNDNPVPTLSDYTKCETNIPSNEIWGGVPAKYIKSRN